MNDTDPLSAGAPGRRRRRADRGRHHPGSASRRARELDLDLVEVAPQANPPVCRIMDYGKYKYERDIRQKEARKKQARDRGQGDQVPPQDRPRTTTARRRATSSGSCRAGSKVKVTIMFRGREMAHTELGRKILDRLVRRPDEMVDRGVDAEAGGAQHDHGDRAQQAAHGQAAAARAPERRDLGGTRADRRSRVAAPRQERTRDEPNAEEEDAPRARPSGSG